jgi:hypothetical protein
MKPIRAILSVACCVLLATACAPSYDPNEKHPSENESPSFEDVDDLSPQTFVADIGSALGNKVGADSTTCNNTNDFSTICNVRASRDAIFSWSAPSSGNFSVSTTGSAIDTVLEARPLSNTSQVLACNDDVSSGNTVSMLSLVNLTKGQRILLIVEGYDSTCGSIQLNIKKSGT